jgi:hypothetical protein
MYSALFGFGGMQAVQWEQLAGRATRSNPFGQAEQRWQRGFGWYTLVKAVLHARSHCVPFQKLLHQTSGPQLSHTAS